jgi:hypothetical protein
MLRKLTPVVLVTVGFGTGLLAQAGDATKVLADMRAAIGGAARVAAVKTFTATGTTLTPTGGAKEVTSQAQYSMSLPDQFLARTMISYVLPGYVYRTAGFNGNTLISGIEASPYSPDSRVTVRTIGMIWPADGLTAEQRAAQERNAMRFARHEFARLALGMFGSSYEAFPLQFSYAGQQSVEGVRAHVIRAAGADDFEARFLLDTTTGLPVMMTWDDLPPWAATSSVRNASAGEAAVLRQIEAQTAQWDRNEAALTPVEHRITYSNFKTVDGLNLPHTLTRTVAGKLKDTTTFDTIQINSRTEETRFDIRK